MNISNLIFKCIYYYCYTKPRGVEILLWYTKQGAAALSLWFNLLAEVYFRMTCINYCLWHFDTLTKVNDWWTATKKTEVDCPQRRPLGRSAKIAAPRESNQTGCSSCDSLHCIPSLYLTVCLSENLQDCVICMRLCMICGCCQGAIIYMQQIGKEEWSEFIEVSELMWSAGIFTVKAYHVIALKISLIKH